jgi:aminopeptidase N
MLHTLLGHEGFRKGSDLYFERHDGQAVTCEDFVQAMADANGYDLTAFLNWYRQAGTPHLEVSREYHAGNRTLTLHMRQHTPPTPGQPEKQPMPIPVKTALLDEHGTALPLRLDGEKEDSNSERILLLEQPEQSFTFIDVPPGTVPSLLRNFSAPVKLKTDYSDEELAFLMGHDDDPFNRREAGQQLALRVLLGQYAAAQNGESDGMHAGLSAAFGRNLTETSLDQALIAEAISLPDESFVAEFIDEVDPLLLHQVHLALRTELAREHRTQLQRVYEQCNSNEPYSIDAASMGRRRLKNRCLGYLMLLGDDAIVKQCLDQYQGADNMTDGLAAMTALTHTGNIAAGEVLADFYSRWKDDNLVLDKWFAIQATSPFESAFDTVSSLAAHADFTLRNPNRVRSLIGAFGMRNPVGFHRADGKGYVFLADFIMELDKLNPQVSARLLTPLTQWRRYDNARQEIMRAQLQRILDCGYCSKDVYEVVSKSLA